MMHVEERGPPLGATQGDPLQAMAQPAIQVRDLSLSYRGTPPVRAIYGVQLEVSTGEVVVVLGPSGCGKTTLLKILAGLLDPSTGEVTVNGKSPVEARVHRESGLIFQNPILLAWRTVRQNILLPLELRSARRHFGNTSAEDLDGLAHKAASLVGLHDFWHAYPHQLSGGMKARVALARTLSYRPAILFMDEPFGSLDEITRTRINDDVLALQRASQATLIIVTHSVAEAAFFADRVIVLSSRPARVRAELKSPAQSDRTTWRDSVEYFGFCRVLRDALQG